MNELFVIGLIGMISLTSNAPVDNNNPRAQAVRDANLQMAHTGENEALRAYYIQSGLDTKVEPYVKHLEAKYLSKDLERFGITAYTLVSVAKDQYIRLTWSF